MVRWLNVLGIEPCRRARTQPVDLICGYRRNARKSARDVPAGRTCPAEDCDHADPRASFDDRRLDRCQLMTELRQSLESADRTVVERGDNRAFYGMGTTLTMAFSVATDLFIVHAGDLCLPCSAMASSSS